MRVIFGAVGLLVVLAIVGLLAKKQLDSASAPLPNLPAVAAPAAGGGEAPPAATPKQQTQQVQQAVEGLMQQPRPMPDNK